MLNGQAPNKGGFAVKFDYRESISGNFVLNGNYPFAGVWSVHRNFTLSVGIVNFTLNRSELSLTIK